MYPKTGFSRPSFTGALRAGGALVGVGLFACGGTPGAQPSPSPAAGPAANDAPVSAPPPVARVPAAAETHPTTGCGEGVSALRFLPGTPTPSLVDSLPRALEALPPGAHVRICPGIHGAAETLTVADAQDVVIDGTGAVVLRPDEGVVLSLERAAGVRVVGLTLARAWASGDDAPQGPPLFEVVGGRDVHLHDVTLDASGSPAIGLRATAGMRVENTTILDAAVAFVLAESPPPPEAATVTVSGGRILRSRALVDPAAAAGHIVRTPATPPLEVGRGQRPTPPLAPLPPAPPAVAALDWPTLMKQHRGAGVRIWQGSAYLVIAHTWGTPPGYPVPPEHAAGRPSPPRPAPKGTGAAELPARDRGHVNLFTPDGPCRAKVGAPVFVDTLGCESGYMTAFPLTGCGTEVAPVALVGPAPPPLRYAQRTEHRAVPGPEALPADARREVVVGAFADSLLGNWARVAAAPDHAVVRSSVGTPVESLEAVYVGFQYPVLECSIFKRTLVEAFAVGAETPARAVALPVDLLSDTPFEGALLLGDRIAALTAANPTTVALHGRMPDGSYTGLFSGVIFTDNAECLGNGPTPLDFDYPCGP
ncbi:hypothetical protein L6V77_21410 [Myxococcota bacterium]|nr:hypothetical protein [Myxococcota bacterium]